MRPEREMTFEQARSLLESCGQSHVLGFWSRLDPDQRRGLLAQVGGLDVESLRRMQALLAGRQTGTVEHAIEPAPVVPLADARSLEAVREGERELSASRVGAILVAGGQGSRLGYEGPKGCFELAPITNASLFEIHSRKILALERKYRAEIPFYIMTSEANDGETRAFFKTHRFFGLDADRVIFFTQGMWPALDGKGRIVLDRPDHLFMNPDGHGGILNAMRVNGVLDDMKRRGVETLFYFQVDNPLVEIADPGFVGLHRRHRAEISVKVCAKRDPGEGLGVVVRERGRFAVVEYTELTPEQMKARQPDGRLKFLYGSVAIHIFSRDFLVREAEASMPLHVAHKKVPFCDEQGSLVKPEQPNAYKFEKFIFDVVPDAERAINVEFAREEEFSPVKNATGNDSPETSRRDMMLKEARRLEACGVKVPRGADGQLAVKIEIDPCYAVGTDDLKRALPKGFAITGDVLLR